MAGILELEGMGWDVPGRNRNKDIETPHRADGSHPGLDCELDRRITGWKQK